LFAFFSLTNVTETVNQIKGSIPDVEQVILRPKVSVSNAFNIEVICTFMFVFVILIVSDARLSPTKQGLLAVLGVVWNLMALTRTAGASGACLNPSVGFAQTILQYTQAVIPDEHF
jgi:glycerol uptake facilitator-like aquaporin